MQLLPHQWYGMWHSIGYINILICRPLSVTQSFNHCNQRTRAVHLTEKKKQNLHFFQIYSPSMSFRASWAHLLHVYGAVFHRFLKADTWHLPLRETSSSTRFSKFCISGGRRPISLSLSPSFLRRCNLKKFCKHGEEKKKTRFRPQHDSYSGAFCKQKPMDCNSVSSFSWS